MESRKGLIFDMKFLVGLLVFGALFGGLHYLGFIGTPSAEIDVEEIRHLEALPLDPIYQSMSVAEAYRAIPHNQSHLSFEQVCLEKSGG